MHCLSRPVSNGGAFLKVNTMIAEITVAQLVLPCSGAGIA
jgi:hypothetical protein